MTKRQVSMREALLHARDREIVREEDWGRLTRTVFSDGTSIFAQSECLGPYSDVTPDLQWEPPTFWLEVP